MKLVCATDFSDTAAHAARAAAALARRFGDTVVLAHAWSFRLLDGLDLAGDPTALSTSVRERAAERLRRDAAELSRGGPTVETALLEGDAPEQITRLARELDARLLVAGTHGRNAAARLFLGSVAERIVLTADRPTLVVPGEPGGLQAWAAGGRPLRVLVGLDASRPSRAAAAWLAPLRAAGPVEPALVHLYWPVEQYQRLGLRGARDPATADREVLEVLSRELRPVADEVAAGEALRIRPCWGSPAVGLADEADRFDADLLLLGTHRRKGLERLRLGSVVHGVLRAAGRPLLAVPATDEAEPATARTPVLRSVLAATDLSPVGDAAVPYAYALLREGGGRVILCHVHERPLPAPAYTHDAPATAALDPERRRALEARLASLIPADAERLGIETEVVVVDGGRAEQVIDQEANRRGVDAVCLGSHGRSGLARALLGSVARAVVERAERPVFVVRARRE